MAAVDNAKLGASRNPHTKGKPKSMEQEEVSGHELEEGDKLSLDEEDEEESQALKQRQQTLEESQEELWALDENVADLAI